MASSLGDSDPSSRLLAHKDDGGAVPVWYRNAAVWRAVLSSFVGSLLESFDLALYAACAGTVFKDVFFPSSFSNVLKKQLTFGAFAVGFFTRPLGAVAFGFVGDRLGRKVTTVWSLSLAGITTAAIGLVPGYKTIGPSASVLLVVLRALQGISFGGEYGGGLLLAYEYAPPRHAALLSCAPQIGGALGGASAFFLLAALGPQLKGIGWRLAFLSSLLMLVLGLYIRHGVDETPVFRSTIATTDSSAPSQSDDLPEHQEYQHYPVSDKANPPYEAVSVATDELLAVDLQLQQRTPLRILLQSQPQPLLLLLGVGATLFDAMYINLMTAFALSLKSRPSPLSPAIARLVSLFLVPMYAAIADVTGPHVMFAVGTVVTGASTYWTFHAINNYVKASPVSLPYIVPLSVLFSSVTASAPPLLVPLFPLHARCTGIGIVYTLSRVLGGGLAPLIASALNPTSSSSLLPVCHYAFGLGVLSSACALLLLRHFHRKRDEPLVKADAVTQSVEVGSYV